MVKWLGSWYFRDGKTGRTSPSWRNRTSGEIKNDDLIKELPDSKLPVTESPQPVMTDGIKPVVIEGIKEGRPGEIGPEKEKPTQPIAPVESTKEFVNNIYGGPTKEICKQSLAECEAGNNVICIKWAANCKESDDAQIGTRKEISYKENKIYFKDKEIKIMPDTASEQAIQALDLKNRTTIELKDTGKPSYEITGEREVRLFGFIKTRMSVKADVDAQTGKIDTKKPWWSIFALG